MGSIAFHYREDSEETRIQREYYKKTTKERECLRCGKNFLSLYAGHRICDKHTQSLRTPDHWGDTGIQLTAECFSDIYK